MQQVSRDLDSTNRIYYFNIYIEKGKGKLVFPSTSSSYKRLALCVRKISFIPYSVNDLKSSSGNIFFYFDRRKVTEEHLQRKQFDQFVRDLKYQREVQFVNVVSFYNYYNEIIETLEIVIFSNEILSDSQNSRCTDIINRYLKNESIELNINGIDLRDIKTYPSWLTQVVTTADNNTHNFGLLFSCFVLRYDEEDSLSITFDIGNINNDYKYRTVSSSEILVQVSLNFNPIIQQDGGFLESVQNSKNRYLNILNAVGSFFKEQVIPEEGVICFGSVGNLFLYLNRQLAFLEVNAITIHRVKVLYESIIAMNKVLLVDTSRFFDYTAPLGIFRIVTESELDKPIEQNFMRLISKNAFQSAVLVNNNYDYAGVLYQGPLHFEAVNPLDSNFVTCVREENQGEISLELQTFTKSDFDLEFSLSTGIIIGELVVIEDLNNITNRLY